MTKNIQRLDCLEDLELLVRGDLIIINYKHTWNYKEKIDEYDAAYYRKTFKGMHEFLVPYRFDSKDITIFSVDAESININNGKIVLSEDCCLQEPFSPTHYSYDGLVRTLQKSGLIPN